MARCLAAAQRTRRQQTYVTQEVAGGDEGGGRAHVQHIQRAGGRHRRHGQHKVVQDKANAAARAWGGG